MTILNQVENKFNLLVGDNWEEWQVLKTFHKGLEISRYTVKRMCDNTEHNLPVEKVEELYNDKKLRL